MPESRLHGFSEADHKLKMYKMGLVTKIILVIIVLHLIIGFGWLFWKLSPREGDKLIDGSDEQ